jgi:hypothetical protein
MERRFVHCFENAHLVVTKSPAMEFVDSLDPRWYFVVKGCGSESPTIWGEFIRLQKVLRANGWFKFWE